jgi:hypothetical protein
MRISWLMFRLLVAYCADTLLFGGIYSGTVLNVTRQVARGVLMGLIRYT